MATGYKLQYKKGQSGRRTNPALDDSKRDPAWWKRRCQGYVNMQTMTLITHLLV
jgi:hypothetical protein